MAINPNDRAQIAAARDMAKSEGNSQAAQKLDQVLKSDARAANAERAKGK